MLPSEIKTQIKQVVSHVKPLHIVIGVGIICLLILLLGGWSIREYKQMHKENMDNYNQLQRIRTEQEKAIQENRIRDSVLYEELQSNNQKREIIRSNAKTKRDENISHLNSASNDDIRRAFATN